MNHIKLSTANGSIVYIAKETLSQSRFEQDGERLFIYPPNTTNYHCVVESYSQVSKLYSEV
jgi:hypothetical protein